MSTPKRKAIVSLVLNFIFFAAWNCVILAIFTTMVHVSPVFGIVDFCVNTSISLSLHIVANVLKERRENAREIEEATMAVKQVL